MIKKCAICGAEELNENSIQFFALQEKYICFIIAKKYGAVIFEIFFILNDVCMIFVDLINSYGYTGYNQIE